jgi:hypothetical protein
MIIILLDRMITAAGQQSLGDEQCRELSQRVREIESFYRKSKRLWRFRTKPIWTWRN